MSIYVQVEAKAEDVPSVLSLIFISSGEPVNVPTGYTFSS